MSTIFISYRRSDSREFCTRMAAELKEYFGVNSVFFDQSSIKPGTRWPSEIRDTLASANIILTVMGPQWLHARDEKSGKRRIDMADDWVREELLFALKHKEMPKNSLEIIPILIGGETMMPDPNDLDEELNKICSYQWIRLPDTGSHHDFDQLKDQIIKHRFQPRILQPVNTPRVGKMPSQLGKDEETDFLNQYTEWDIVETEEHGVPGDFKRELHRVYEFTTFDTAFEYMTEVTKRGIQAMNHHPRWENAYNRIEIWLCTFNIGHKPSKRDVKLAKIFEEVWLEFKSRLWEKRP